VDPAPDTSLRPRLLSFIRGLNADPRLELNECTSLLQSGLLDSAAMLQLAEWIQREVGADVDLLQFDLSKEWDTIVDIEGFIQRCRHNQTG
jgi:aryl carrier-like protein